MAVPKRKTSQAKTSGRKAAQFIARVDNANLPIKGATATMSKVKCSAVPVAFEYKEINGTWYCDSLDSGEPQEIITDKPVAFSWLDWIWFSRFNIIRSGYCMKSELPGTLAQQRHKEVEHELFRKTKRPQNPCAHFCDFCFAASDGFPGFCHSGNKNSPRRLL